MSGISTKGVKKAYISKEIKPGNVVAKINNIKIEQVKTPKDASNPEYKIYIDLETKPIGGEFIGYDKEYGNPAKGQHLGQIKTIQFSNWPIRDNKGVSEKTGKAYDVKATATILEFLQKLLTEVGHDTWLEDNDGKFATWEQLFSGIVRSGALKDKYFSWCLAGKESLNAKNYTVYYMYLPERKHASAPFAIEGGIVTKFDQSIHIEIDKKTVGENQSLNDGVDEDDSVARENETDEFAVDDSLEDPFTDDEELFDLED